MISEWKHWPEFKKMKFRKSLIGLVAASPDREVSRELVELALVLTEPALEHRTVDDDDFHALVIEVYDAYVKMGAAD